MFRRVPLAVAVFALWTLLVWSNRIYNIVAKDGGDGVDLVRAVGFVAIGLVVAAVAVRPMSPSVAHRVVSVAAWASIALWATRIVTIPLGDHAVGFIVVHLVLAAVSIAVAVWAMRSTRSRLDPHRPSTGTDVADRATTHA